MVETKHQQLTGLLTALYERFEQEGDYENAQKVLQLLRKWIKNQFVMAFCGHFSAGKSSMINELVGHSLLPASPIPTSANLVSVQGGEEHATIHYTNGEAVRYPAPYDFEKIKQFCKLGDEISEVHLSVSANLLPKDVVVMDTPGIDSTDDAHRIATESALHLADVIFYVMDYNHVQSELNFQFTKRLKEQGKRVYLIINQIDKHRDSELSFASFQHAVSSSFANWNVYPDGIFYTSIKKPEYPGNQLADVKRFISGVVQEHQNGAESSIRAALHTLIDDHIQFVERKSDLYIEQMTEELANTNDTALIIERLKAMEEARKSGTEQKDVMEKVFRTESKKIIENANIMTYPIRELARAFVESMQPGFKVGLLFSKKKTEQERIERLDAFYASLQEQVTAQLDWHVRQYLTGWLKKFDLQSSDLKDRAEAFSVSFSKEMLAQLVKTGAVLSGDYVLVYTNDVMTEIRKQAERESTAFLTDALVKWSSNEEERLASERTELQAKGEYERASQLLEQQRKELREAEQALGNLMKEHPKAPSDERIHQMIQEQFQWASAEQQEQVQAVDISGETFEVSEAPITVSTTERTVEQTILALDQAIEVTGVLEQLSSIQKQMKKRKENLQNQSFTVALFGAFSAGKSSFANALIGESVLPVSPNPTTATINKIVPPTPDHPHQTVQVTLKTEAALLTELKLSLRFFQYDVSTMEEALKAIAEVERTNPNVDAKKKLHLSFLQAVQKGYKAVSAHLGKSLQITLAEFGDYVAKEYKACFVEMIELFYDCAITQKGITLVDTPGADSINARHTGVAFNYIKSADAVLFVTYYNHAFSKADREFLIQLGRVKDLFSLDKMFFLINAADLASSKEELNTVIRYVHDQLTQYGIRFPRLFPISSLEALQDEMNPKFVDFKQRFYHFIENELREIVMKAAYEDMKTAHDMIHEIEELQTAAQRDEKGYLQHLSQKEEQSLLNLEEVRLEIKEDVIHQEIKELLYYVNQRVFLRYSDFFRESFNPATIKEEKGKIKEQLARNLRELLEAMSFDTMQELRATTLRMEQFLTKKAFDRHRVFLQQVESSGMPLQPEGLTITSFPAFEFSPPIADDDIALFEPSLQLYKNSKRFFAKNEKEKMKTAIQEKAEPLLKTYLQQEEQVFAKDYIQTWHTYSDAYFSEMREELIQYFDGLRNIVRQPIDQDHLKKWKQDLLQLLQ
ncbi:dynamin family protein [Priestia koreensis]|uniref:dynamin family protein n=1 Tax=Priestia koreensis TaxID=284581 RepID=UPI0028F6FEE2|nr:dynamin family protein [Priestia koreensis]